MVSLKNQSISSVKWTGIDIVLQRVFRLLFSFLLARLLSPADFGVIGVTSIFVAISSVFVDSGFKDAIIRKNDLSVEDYSTAVIFNISIGVFFYALLFMASPIIADFFNMAILINVLRLLGIGIIFNSIGISSRATLERALLFKKVASVSIVSVIVSSIMAVTLAINNFGVYALVSQQLVMLGLINFSFMVMSPIKPKLFFSISSFKELFSFGSKIFASGFINIVFVHIYSFIIGKLFSASILGFYSQAKRIQEVPNTSLSNIIGRVSYPILSKIQDEKERLLKYYRFILKSSILVNLPVMFIIILSANSFVSVVLTEKWLPSLPYIYLLCIGGLIFPLHTTNLNILKVKGRSDLFLKLEIIKKILIVIILLLSIKFGIIGIVVGEVFLMYIAFFINSYYSGKLIGYGVLSQLNDIFKYFFVSFLVFFVVSYIISNISFSFMFLIVPFFYLPIYLLVFYLLKDDVLLEWINILKGLVLRHES